MGGRFQDPPYPLQGLQVTDYQYSGFFQKIVQQFDMISGLVINLGDPYWRIGQGDDMAALRAAGAELQAAGGGTIEANGLTIDIFPDVYDTGTATGEDNILFDFDGLDGLNIFPSGAKFTSSGSFPVDAIRVIFIKCEDCTRVHRGPISLDYTGDRDWSAGDPLAASERRGIIFCKWVGENVDISGPRSTANACSYGDWFVADGNTRNITLEGLTCNQTGYPLWAEGSGHGMTCYVLDVEDHGRCATIKNVDDSHVFITSKNPTGSTDGGMSGNCNNSHVFYRNTETDAGEIGRCFGLGYTVLSDNPNAHMRNCSVTLDIRFTGANYSDLAFFMGMSVGSLPADADPNYRMTNTKVSGLISSAVSTGPQFLVEFPSPWSVGANLSGIDFSDLTIIGGGACTFDLRGLIDTATFRNFRCASEMGLKGNTVSKILCLNLEAPETTGSNVDTSYIDYVSCNVTTGANFSYVNTNGLSTFVAGTLKSWIGVTLKIGTQPTYAVSNVTTDRTYDANATSLDEVADALGTLIADLRTMGLVL